jgi:hypothetical protein
MALFAPSACAPHLRVAEEWLSATRVGGGPAPVIRGFTIYKDGLIEYSDGSATHRWSRLRPSELDALQAIFASNAWREGIAYVETKGAHWSCCDRETIGISFYGEGSYSIPLTDVHVTQKPSGPPDVVESPGVPASLHPGLSLLDTILRRHFGSVWDGWGADFNGPPGAV